VQRNDTISHNSDIYYKLFYSNQKWIIMLTRIIKLATITAIFLALQACQGESAMHNIEFETLHILRDAQAPDSTAVDTLEEMVVELDTI
jgi:hypothetical protein